MDITPLIPNMQVYIADKTKPIVIPFGPPSCGKLLLTCRLFKHLYCHGLHVDLDFIFLPPHLSQQYKIEENWFRDFLFNNSTNHRRPMIPLMFRVIHSGNLLCYLLYQNGESYFDISHIASPVRLLEIMQSPNKKIWLFLLPLNWCSMDDRINYVNRIIELSHLLGKTDEVIFVVPKIDLYNWSYNAKGKVDLNRLWQQVKMLYPGLFAHFKTKQFFLHFFKPYTFDFCAFSSGDFFKTSDHREVFDLERDLYPEYLWKLIKKHI